MTDSLLVYTDCFFLCVFLSDITEKTELKTFFESNCSQIYFIFYENFITLESNLKQKGKKHPASWAALHSIRVAWACKILLDWTNSTPLSGTWWDGVKFGSLLVLYVSHINLLHYPFRDSRKTV